MELNIDVCTGSSCKVIIKDLTEIGDNGYLPETSDVTVTGRFKYSDTVSIDLLQHNKSSGAELQTPVYSLHTEDIEDIVLPVNFDGWFTVVHIVLPTSDWFNTELAKTSGSALTLYDTVYYSDGTNVYKYVDGSSQEASLAELVERNIENTTISIVCKNYVSICFLKKCYISLCQKILNERCFSECPEKMNVDSDLVFKRDYVWMAINVIKYLVQFKQLAEAESVIARLGGCNGLCKSEQVHSSGCNCGR